MTSCQFFEYLQESRPQKDILLSPINFLLTDCEWSLPHVSNMSRVFPVLCFMCCWRMLNPLWPVVWKLQKSCDSFDPLRCKACAQLSEKACHEVRAQATQQVSNETRATVLEKVGQELTLPWKQEKKWKEMKRKDKKWQEMTRNDKKWKEMKRN